MKKGGDIIVLEEYFIIDYSLLSQQYFYFS